MKFIGIVSGYLSCFAGKIVGFSIAAVVLTFILDFIVVPVFGVIFEPVSGLLIYLATGEWP